MVLNPGIRFILMTVLTLTTGTAFIMWLGEQITDRGIGNGMSLLIFTGIIAGLPRGVIDLVQKVQTNQWGSFTIVAVLSAGCVHVRRGGLHRLCRAQRAAHSHPERAAHRRPADDGRPVQPLAPQGQLRRRDAGHLRRLHPLRAA